MPMSERTKIKQATSQKTNPLIERAGYQTRLFRMGKPACSEWANPPVRDAQTPPVERAGYQTLSIAH
jgi:hypothetical protein